MLPCIQQPPQQRIIQPQMSNIAKVEKPSVASRAQDDNKPIKKKRSDLEIFLKESKSVVLPPSL